MTEKITTLNHRPAVIDTNGNYHVVNLVLWGVEINKNDIWNMNHPIIIQNLFSDCSPLHLQPKNKVCASKSVYLYNRHYSLKVYRFVSAHFNLFKRKITWYVWIFINHAFGSWFDLGSNTSNLEVTNYLIMMGQHLLLQIMGFIMVWRQLLTVQQ